MASGNIMSRFDVFPENIQLLHNKLDPIHVEYIHVVMSAQQKL